MPVAESEVYILMFEPKSTLNNGSANSDKTISNQEKI